MTAKELNKMYRGRRAFYQLNELSFPVQIETAERAYNKIFFTIVPIGGAGRIKTKEANITFTAPIVKRERKPTTKTKKLNHNDSKSV